MSILYRLLEEREYLPGVLALREGIARSVEMGRSVIFHFGPTSLATGAKYITPGISILQHIANVSGELNAHLIVTTLDPMLLAWCQDLIRTEYRLAGREDSEVDVRYVAATGFSYAAAMMGLIQKEKPGAHFLMGTGSFSSIIECETATSVGAFQVGGSLSTTQLPMLLATCDYTLLGEEYAVAGVTLSKNIGVLGCVAGEDWGKAIVMVTSIIGAILIQFDIRWLASLFGG